jgi:hypothetical protein
MNEYTWHTFPNIGYIKTVFTKEQLAPILEEIDKIKQDFENCANKKFNQNLAGHIDYEYQLVDTHDYISNLLMPFVDAFDKEFNYNNRFQQQSRATQISLRNTWVNFQKKYEFNPSHMHGGFLSWVIWINVPYNIHNEILSAREKGFKYQNAGDFEFCYTDSLGSINPFKIPVDKSMEGTMVMFPSGFIHQVYPFYTSDDYRISVSGNFQFDV